VVFINNAGDVKISCSCNSCTMLINQIAVPGNR
jgi:hypothetical protein